MSRLEEARDFFVAFFAATPNQGYHNPKTGLSTYFLTFDGGAKLELMAKPGLADGPGPLEQGGYTHLAFSVGDRDGVNALTARLEQAGYPVLSGPRVTGDGFYESLVCGPEGCRIEITV